MNLKICIFTVSVFFIHLFEFFPFSKKEHNRFFVVFTLFKYVSSPYFYYAQKLLFNKRNLLLSAYNLQQQLLQNTIITCKQKNSFVVKSTSINMKKTERDIYVYCVLYTAMFCIRFRCPRA